MADGPIIYVDNVWTLSFVFYSDEDHGTVKDLSSATTITVEIYDVPGTAIGTFECTVADPGDNFNVDDLATGVLVFKGISTTLVNATYLTNDQPQQTHKVRCSVESDGDGWASPGLMAEDILTVTFSE